ncbi:MAG: hypothetical protein ACYC91_00835 [Solirubrobacteraceae bacterium]
MRASGRPSAGDSRRADRLRFAALAALGAWTIVVPYLGRAVGLEVNVASSVEIADHVLPGTLIVGISAYVALGVANVASSMRRLIGGGLCFLAGFWVLATHVPLLSDAVQDREPWGPALWHASTAVPIVVLSLWIVLKEA